MKAVWELEQWKQIQESKITLQIKLYENSQK